MSGMAEPIPAFRLRWPFAPAQAVQRPHRAQERANQAARRQDKRRQLLQAMRPRRPKAKAPPMRSHTIRLPRMIRELRAAPHTGTEAMGRRA